MAPRQRRHIRDFQPDPNNRRTHTPRNRTMLRDALSTVGAARSIVIDEHDTILAGNGIAEAAADIGITKVQIVEADGDTLVAVRRSGLTPEQKRSLAMFDNRAAELSTWDSDQLADDKAAGLTLTPFFTDGELSKLLGTQTEARVREVQTSAVADRFWISIRGPLQAQAQTLQRMRAILADLDGVDVELGSIEGHEPEAWPK